MIFTYCQDAYQLFKNRSDYDLEKMTGDEWLEERATRQFIDGLFKILDNIGFYNRPSYFFYRFKGWIGDDMILEFVPDMAMLLGGPSYQASDHLPNPMLSHNA